MNNYDYPEGTDVPAAPWNEPEQPYKKFELCYTCELSNNVTVDTKDYDEDLNLNNPYGDYCEQHYRPIQLIWKLQHIAGYLLDKKDFNCVSEKCLQKIIKECENWECVNEEIM